MSDVMKYKIEQIINYCLKEKTSVNPIQIAKSLMRLPFVNIHGTEHHMLDGASFLTAMRNAGGDFDLEESLTKLAERAEKMPGAMCGYWGMCGSVASLGASLAIIHGTSPLSDNDFYKDNMEYTSKVMTAMSKIGGPRCCKRNAFLSIMIAIDFVKEKYGIQLEKEKISCEFSPLNEQCIKDKCPFYKAQATLII